MQLIKIKEERVYFDQTANAYEAKIHELQQFIDSNENLENRYNKLLGENSKLNLELNQVKTNQFSQRPSIPNEKRLSNMRESFDTSYKSNAQYQQQQPQYQQQQKQPQKQYQQQQQYQQQPEQQQQQQYQQYKQQPEQQQYQQQPEQQQQQYKQQQQYQQQPEQQQYQQQPEQQQQLQFQSPVFIWINLC